MCHLKSLKIGHKLKSNSNRGVVILSGLKIKQYRLKKNYSQKELAKLFGVSARTVLRWEQNTNKPSPEEAQRVASIIGITVEELLSDEDDVTEHISDETKQSVLDRLSDSVDNLVTGQETINETLVSNQGKDDKRQEEIIGELRKQNELILSEMATYRESFDSRESELRHRRIRTVIIVVTCLIVLTLVICTWIYWMNYGFVGKDKEGSAEMGTPSYYEIDDDQ